LERDEYNKNFGFKNNELFYLRSKLPMQRVMEATGANNVVLKKYAKGRIAQQFFFDPVSKTIKSKQWTSYCMEQSGTSLTLRSSTSRWMQLFTWKAPYLANYKEKTKVADVSNGEDTENRNIEMRVNTGKL
jgi:hypothetical protein